MGLVKHLRRNQSVSYIRLGGRATLTIEYNTNDYKLTDARDPVPTVSVSAGGTANSQ